MQRRAFNLIDLSFLLTALLILVPFLLPALHKSRTTARLSVSLSNLRQLGMGSATYRADYKDYLPILWTGSPGKPQGNPDDCTGLCSWSAWGKYNDGWWYSHNATPPGSHDLYPADRPMNPYVVPAPLGERPAQRVAADDPVRKSIQLASFKDPAELVGHQRNPPNANAPEAGAPALSCYDDVGSSYQWASKWFAQIEAAMPDKHGLVPIKFALKRLQLGEGYVPARFCWAFDENPLLVANNPDARSLLTNACGDTNKGSIVFFDGHAAYTTITPGGGVESFTNERYSMFFEDLAVPNPK